MSYKQILQLMLLIAQTCIMVCAQDYDQPYRPQVHFSPRKNWTNDPDGLVYFQGEYHLFFQYNPFGDQWGHISWVTRSVPTCCTGANFPSPSRKSTGS